jgi:dUTP pyrophosphatase
MQIKFKKLYEDAVPPQRMTDGAAGFDLTAHGMNWLNDQKIQYTTGIAVEIPPGYVGYVFPRSSCYKRGMLLTNCVGVIDSDYRGEISFVYEKKHRQDHYHQGERIGQLIIMPIPAVEFIEVSELSDTARGAGGYGSTGK